MICPDCGKNNALNAKDCEFCHASLSFDAIPSDLLNRKNVRESFESKLLKEAVSNKYAIHREIGAGGFGIVFECEHLQLGNKKAIKVLLLNHSRNDKIVKRFKDEARLASCLDHPNIVKIQDIDEAPNGIHYFIMDFIEGPTLRDLIEKEHGLSVRKTIEITIGIAEGLAYAHRKNIIHRDIKPQNILIKNERTPIITDFGLAKAISLETQQESTSASGSQHYMSPEQVRSQEVDHRSDQYSLGITMYEMLTGNPPFTGKGEIRYQHITDAADPIQSINPNIPDHLAQIVHRMIQKNKDDRFPDIRAFLTELKKIDIEQKDPSLIERLNAGIFSRVREAITKRKFDEAIEICKNGLKVDSDNFELDKLLERTEKRKEEYEEARSLLRTGRSHLQNNQFGKAIECFEKALILDEANPDIRKGLDEAKKLLADAIKEKSKPTTIIKPDPASGKKPLRIEPDIFPVKPPSGYRNSIIVFSLFLVACIVSFALYKYGILPFEKDRPSIQPTGTPIVIPVHTNTPGQILKPTVQASPSLTPTPLTPTPKTPTPPLNAELTQRIQNIAGEINSSQPNYREAKKLLEIEIEKHPVNPELKKLETVIDGKLKTAETELKYIRELMKNEKYAEAKTRLNTLIKWDPFNNDARDLLQDVDGRIARSSTAPPTDTATPSATPTRIPTKTPVQTSTAIPTLTLTPTKTPTSTQTPVNTPTRTSIPTSVPTKTSSPTPLTSTITPTQTGVPTKAPTARSTQTATPTRTPVPASTKAPTAPPTQTATTTPSNTPTRTSVPTSAPTKTASPTPLTSTITPKQTSVPAKAPTTIATQTATPTRTPVPASTKIPSAPPTQTATKTPIEPPTPGPTQPKPRENPPKLSEIKTPKAQRKFDATFTIRLTKGDNANLRIRFSYRCDKNNWNATVIPLKPEETDYKIKIPGSEVDGSRLSFFAELLDSHENVIDRSGSMDSPKEISILEINIGP